ncbi:hypothetical protein HER15_07345 [Tenacibaculum mesophilum]|uniref:Uncharacterized protein n=1 Tax=Tenacibaculum mesophilum TaxID=104268 RepID=A0AAE9MNF0_9FLAO|nr:MULTISPECIES: hypothetical protein [Tenacibaculum]MCO7186502.1 hypothetical protein [Tenacibaculum sp. XPcli2-G]UTD15288.1 hypothetical protein HER15_07345 [Tenacibaculum mesophilum]
MKKIFLLSVLTLLTITIQAQQTLFEALENNGDGATYQGFGGLVAKGDGTYNFNTDYLPVKIELERTPSGIPVGFEARFISENKRAFRETELSDYGTIDNYVYPMSIKHGYTKKGYMVIDDLLFELRKIYDGSAPRMENVTSVYVLVKDRKATAKTPKKKKGGFLSRMKAKIKSARNSSVPSSPTYKYLTSLNLDKKFNDYVVAMKKKQAIPLTAKDKAKIGAIKKAKKMDADEIKRYNDSIRATPEYKKLKEHQARMKAMDEGNALTTVTFINRTGKDIYVFKAGSKNSTTIRANSSSKFNCSYSYSYKFNPNSGGSGLQLYNANSGCERSVIVK